MKYNDLLACIAIPTLLTIVGSIIWIIWEPSGCITAEKTLATAVTIFALLLLLFDRDGDLC